MKSKRRHLVFLLLGLLCMAWSKKIFRTMKSRIQYFEDHYVWNYWEPFGAWDIDPETDAMRHWVNVHPYRNYQAGEIGDIVEAYHTGIVFDRTDIERILNTNLKVMWNGDRGHPQWRNSNARGEWKQPPPPPEGWTGRAGALWTGLIDFSRTVRDLYEPHLKPGSIPHAYYHSVTAEEPPGFRRKYVAGEPEGLPEISFSECKDLHMAAVLPRVIRRGTPSILISKSVKPGELEIAFHTTGGEKVRVLHCGETTGGSDGHAGVFIFRWDGTDPEGMETYAGNYRIRWTLGEGHREFPITVK